MRRKRLIAFVKSVNIRTCSQKLVVFWWLPKIFGVTKLGNVSFSKWNQKGSSKFQYRRSVTIFAVPISQYFCCLLLDLEQLIASVCSLSKLITSYAFIFFTNPIRSALCSEWPWRGMGAYRRLYYLGRLGKRRTKEVQANIGIVDIGTDNTTK